MFIPTLLRGVRRNYWGEYWIHVLEVHGRILQMGKSVPIFPSREGDIYYSFTYPVSLSQCQGISRGIILHLCPSLWHWWWCWFGVHTDDKYEDILLRPICVLVMGRQWCCLVDLYVVHVYLLCTECNIWWVCHGWIRKRIHGQKWVLWSRPHRFDVPSLAFLPYIAVHILASDLAWLGSGSPYCT